MKLFILFFLVLSLFGGSTNYDKVKTKNRSKLQKENDYFQHKKYLYIDDKNIRENLKNSKKKSDVNIGTIVIGQKSKVKEAVVYVKSNKNIRIKNKDTINIGVISVDKKNRQLKKIESNVDLKSVIIK